MAEKTANGRVTREPLTYHEHSAESYFRDLIADSQGDTAANRRLEQHGREMRVELSVRDQRAMRELRAAADELELELRVNPSRTTGQGGSFAPPLWLLDRFATAPAPRRVLAALMPSLPLPASAQSVSLPRLTTGTQTTTQTDGGTVADRDVVDAQVTSQVVTIAGQEDVAMQTLEQSPRGAAFDLALYRDLREAYNGTLETQLINGSGGISGPASFTGQLPGILNLATGANGVNAVTYTSGTPKGPEQYPFVGQMAAQIGDNRLLPPEAWLMRTARWAWLATSEDTATMPLVGPNYNPSAAVPPVTPADQPDPVGVLLGWPIFPDDAIPATFSGNQDRLIGCRPTDHLLLESDERARVTIEPLSGTMQARVQLYRYAAHLPRYPQGLAVLSGTGMAVASGF